VLTGRGLTGFVLLQRKLEAAQGSPWVTQIHLNNAVKTGNITVLRYLIDEAGVQTLNREISGYTALQMAVVWGQLDIIVYLLTRGADPLLWKDGGSAADQARVRQERLHAYLERSADLPRDFSNLDPRKVASLYEEGKVMLEVLEGVESAGSYVAWARAHRGHPLVKRFSWDLADPEPRRRLAVLRTLALLGRAALRPAAERAMRPAAPAEEEAEPLAQALAKLGLGSRARELQDALQLCSVAELREARLLREEFEARLRGVAGVTDGQHRRLWRFVVELQQPAAAPQAKAALLSAAGRAAKAPTAAKVPTPFAPAAWSPQRAQADFLDVLFHEGLPDSAFMLVTRFLLGLRRA